MIIQDVKLSRSEIIPVEIYRPKNTVNLIYYRFESNLILNYIVLTKQL